MANLLRFWHAQRWFWPVWLLMLAINGWVQSNALWVALLVTFNIVELLGVAYGGTLSGYTYKAPCVYVRMLLGLVLALVVGYVVNPWLAMLGAPVLIIHFGSRGKVI